MSDLLSWDAAVSYGDGSWLRESAMEPIALDLLPQARSICIWQGDITKLSGGSTAVVNAANWSLKRGGGVCGVIHRAAGPDLEAACFEAFPCGLGTTQCLVTPAFGLPASHVIHAVTPMFGSERDLEATYRNALVAAEEAGLSEVCFPALACGSHLFDGASAARIAVRAVALYLSERPGLRVALCAFTEQDLLHSRAAMAERFHRAIAIDKTKITRRASSIEDLEARMAALGDA